MTSVELEHREGKSWFHYSPSLRIQGDFEDVRRYKNRAFTEPPSDEFKDAVITKVRDSLPNYLRETTGEIRLSMALRYRSPLWNPGVYIDIKLRPGPIMGALEFTGGKLEGVVNFGLCAQISDKERVGLEIVLGALIHGSAVGYSGERITHPEGGSYWQNYPSIITGGADWTIISRVELPTKERMYFINKQADRLQSFFDGHRSEIIEVMRLLQKYRDFRAEYVSPFLKKRNEIDLLLKEAKEKKKDFPEIEMPAIDEVITFSKKPLQSANGLLDLIRPDFPRGLGAYLFVNNIR